MENLLTHAQTSIAFPMQQDNQAPIKPYLISEIAKLYGISDTTATRWRKMVPGLETVTGKILNVKEVEAFFNHHGRPYLQ